jgi:sensor histidine kinase YesM
MTNTIKNITNKKDLNIFFNFLLILFFLSSAVRSQNAYSAVTVNLLDSLHGNLEKAIKEKDSLGISRAYYKLAVKYDYLGERDSSDYYYDKALTLANILNNNKAIAVISNSLATSYSEKGLHNKAIKIYNNSVKRFLSLKDSAHAADIMLNVSSEYIDIGQYRKALEISLKALNLKLSSADSTNISAYYLQIGGIFNALGNKNKWLEYVSLANFLAKKNNKYGDFYRRMDILGNLGDYYFSEKRYETAKKYYDTLYTKSKQHDYLAGITTSLSRLVSILVVQKKYNEALKFSQKAIELAEKNNNIYKLIANLIETAKLQRTLSKNSGAEKNLLRAKKLALSFNYPSELLTIYKLLSEINFDKKKYKTAYEYLLQHQTLKDSIKSSETNKIVTELETKYQTEKKDNQIALLNKENLLNQERIAKQKRTVIIIVVLSLLVISLLALFYLQNKLKNQNRILDLNNKLLRTQMNPHFMFNALIAIQNYILKNKKFEASDYLSQFATLMRSILSSSRKDFITLKEEIELLKYYVSLQQLRFENSFNFKLEIDENIDTESYNIPPMIIQPFVENAIEHGLKTSTNKNKFLSIKYLLNNNFLHIFIEDNGIGIKQSKENESKKEHQSFAMLITNERLLNIKKLYKEEITISITDLSETENTPGTKIEFGIPLSLIERN